MGCSQLRSFDGDVATGALELPSHAGVSDDRWKTRVQENVSSVAHMNKPRAPPRLPEGDDRFNPRVGPKTNQDPSGSWRVHVCVHADCGGVHKYLTQALRYDGAYVRKTWPLHTPPSKFYDLWFNGEIDATWWCSTCHRREGESLEATRKRIGASYDRQSRTAPHRQWQAGHQVLSLKV